MSMYSNRSFRFIVPISIFYILFTISCSKYNIGKYNMGHSNNHDYISDDFNNKILCRIIEEGDYFAVKEYEDDFQDKSYINKQNSSRLTTLNLALEMERNGCYKKLYTGNPNEDTLYKVVKALLNAEADHSIANPHLNLTPIDQAKSLDRDDVVKLFQDIEDKNKINTFHNLLCNAIKNGQWTTVESLTEKIYYENIEVQHYTLNKKDINGLTPLELALNMERIKRHGIPYTGGYKCNDRIYRIVKALLLAGAEPNVLCDLPPVIEAKLLGRDDVVKLLLDGGADMYQKCLSGYNLVSLFKNDKSLTFFQKKHTHNVYCNYKKNVDYFKKKDTNTIFYKMIPKMIGKCFGSSDGKSQVSQLPT